MPQIQIKVNDNGSLRITGDVELLDGEGNVYTTKPSFSLCRCGLSNNKPFPIVHIKVNSNHKFGFLKKNKTTTSGLTLASHSFFICPLVLYQQSHQLESGAPLQSGLLHEAFAPFRPSNEFCQSQFHNSGYDNG